VTQKLQGKVLTDLRLKQPHMVQCTCSSESCSYAAVLIVFSAALYRRLHCGNHPTAAAAAAAATAAAAAAAAATAAAAAAAAAATAADNRYALMHHL
jgi:hypothetical protein